MHLRFGLFLVQARLMSTYKYCTALLYHPCMNAKKSFIGAHYRYLHYSGVNVMYLHQRLLAGARLSQLLRGHPNYVLHAERPDVV